HAVVGWGPGAGLTCDTYLGRWQALLGDGYLLACPTLVQGAWWTRQAEELVLATIRAVQARYRIDPDRCGSGPGRREWWRAPILLPDVSTKHLGLRSGKPGDSHRPAVPASAPDRCRTSTLLRVPSPQRR